MPRANLQVRCAFLLLLTTLFACSDPSEPGGQQRAPAGPDAIAVEMERACAIAQDGGLSCWETMSPSGVTIAPARVGEMMFGAVTVGDDHVCALSAEGEAYCWGSNDWGQLGIGTSNYAAAPAAVEGGLQFQAIAAGADHTCAVAEDGSAYCWGILHGGGGEDLCVGGLSCSDTPTPVPGDRRFTLVVAGLKHVCALEQGGAAYCWGSNHWGQLGIGGESPYASGSPLEVAGGMFFTRLTAGPVHTCGVTHSGSAYCWGGNDHAQLGTGDTLPRLAPAPVTGGLSFRSIVAGSGFTCALRSTGDAYCWGRNLHGRLGTGSQASSVVPAAVAGGHHFEAIAAGPVSACGIRSDGRVLCWGSPWGPLGSEEYAPLPRTGYPEPVAVAEDPGAVQVSAGGDVTCALDGDGRAYCWGRNRWDQLGASLETPVPTCHRGPYSVLIEPCSLMPVPVRGDVRFATISQSGIHGCGSTAAGETYCWGYPWSWDEELAPGPVRVAEGLNVVAVSAGRAYTCALTDAGAAHCWGSNADGELGDGTTTPSPSPVLVAGGHLFAAIAAGTNHTCGLTSGGRAYCWGSAFWGALGNGEDSGVRTTPVAVAGDLVFTTLSVATAGGGGELGGVSCALTEAGTGYCWGSNTIGQLGVGGTAVTATTPVAVAGGHTWRWISAGAYHSCGVTTDYTAYCWGTGPGLGSSTEKAGVPVPVAGGQEFRYVEVGDHHSCGITRNGATYCWGAFTEGQLGATAPFALQPVPASAAAIF